MTTPIVSVTDVAKKPYSPQRMAKMDRADRITRILFAARRRGEAMTNAQAIEIIDTEIDAANDSGDDDGPKSTSMVFTRCAVQKLVADGRFFSVTFIKRTTGESRHMQARLGVTKRLKGGAKQYDDAGKNLLTVFSTDANGYRSIPIDLIQSITVKGITFVAAQSFAQAA